MKQISPADTLFVQVMSFGATLLNTSITGISGYGDVYRSISGMLPDCGMVRVNVRNRTQGWSEQRNIYFRR